MTLPRGRLSAATAAFITLIAVVAPACNSEKPGAVKLCCDQPRIPPGVPPFAVVIDEVTGPTDGQDVKMRVAFKQKTKRDDVYPALHFLYRYAMTRNTFEPINFVGELYATEGGAQTGGNPVANGATEKGSGPESPTNRITIVSKDGVEALPIMTKEDAAEAVLDRVGALLSARE